MWLVFPPFGRRFGLAASMEPRLQLRRGAGCGQRVVQNAGVFALCPGLVTVRLETLHKRVHGDLHHVLTACTLCGGKRIQQHQNKFRTCFDRETLQHLLKHVRFI